MESNILDIKKIRIFDAHNEGAINFLFGPSQYLFVWKGDVETATILYRSVRELMSELKFEGAHFQKKVSHCEAAWGNCAYITGADLTPPQKYQLAKGIESKGYAIKIEPPLFEKLSSKDES